MNEKTILRPGPAEIYHGGPGSRAAYDSGVLSGGKPLAPDHWQLAFQSLAVPVFFIIAGFLLFRKIPDTDKKSGWPVVGRYAWRIVKLYLLSVCHLLAY